MVLGGDFSKLGKGLRSFFDLEVVVGMGNIVIRFYLELIRTS
jgi:hypothetical protein